jgi:hypothetical protein
MSQANRLLSYLKVHKVIDPYQAVHKLGIMRLAARIHDLRCAGVDIRTTYIEGVNQWHEDVRFAEYRLMKLPKATK